MLTDVKPELRRSVMDAIKLVNTHSGRATVSLRFNDEASDVDFVANSARVEGERFVFQAGFETYAGDIEDLTSIRAELIGSA